MRQSKIPYDAAAEENTSHIHERNPREKLLLPEDAEAKEGGRSTGKWEPEPKSPCSPFSALPTSSSCPGKQWGGGGPYPALKSNSYEGSPKLSWYLPAKEHSSMIRYNGINTFLPQE